MSYPNRDDKIPALQTIVLHKAKVAAQGILSPQAAHDLSLNIDYDPMLREKVLELRTWLYRAKLGDEEKEVRIAKRIPYDVSNRVAATAAIGWLLAISAIFLAANGTIMWAFTILFIAFLAVIFGLVSAPNYVDIDEKVKIPAQYWHTFPDNKMIYPDNLGHPIVQVEVGKPKLVEGE